ncbi:hypothetical protein GLA29479_4061 [Lysobacter antibioticus]|nr:hypothetical protein GLA29479_4061 [Lysobacter antibioticus]
MIAGAEARPPSRGGASMPGARKALRSRRFVESMRAPHDLRRLAPGAVAPMLAASTQ